MEYKESSSIHDLLYGLGKKLLDDSQELVTRTWQGIDASNLQMREIRHVFIGYNIPDDKRVLKAEVEPNLPWAEDHFQERVGGLPLNPGEQYKNWPFYKMDDKMRNVGEKFSHSYMERFWPKKAWDEDTRPINGVHTGIRFNYGDLNDVAELLLNDEHTRQAYLPVWFPEDTGVVHGKRVPCTLGYLFEIRNDKVDVTYYIRSCDYIRHLRDDIYLACRLGQWIRNYIEDTHGGPGRLQMGTLRMHIANLHIFDSDSYYLKKQLSKM